MTLPASGAISLGAVAAELGIALPLSLGDARVLALAGKTVLPISLSDLYGKSAYTPMSGTMPAVNMRAQSNPPANTNATAPITAAITGGAAPFTFTWSKLSGAGSVDAANATSTTVRMPVARFSSPGDVSNQTVQLVVVDGTGASLTLQALVTLTLD